MWGTAVHGPFQLSACLVSLPPRPGGPGQSLAPRASARLTRGFDSCLFRPAWDILHFPSLPLWEPLSPPLHLASGDAQERAVASGAWLGTRDPHRQLRQHHEHRVHPLWICTYSPPCSPPPHHPASVCTPAPPRPALPTAHLAAPLLSSSLSESESHRLVFLPLSHPGSREKGWNSPKAQ